MGRRDRDERDSPWRQLVGPAVRVALMLGLAYWLKRRARQEVVVAVSRFGTQHVSNRLAAFISDGVSQRVLRSAT